MSVVLYKTAKRSNFCAFKPLSIMWFFGGGFEGTQILTPPPKGDNLSIHAKFSLFMITEH